MPHGTFVGCRSVAFRRLRLSPEDGDATRLSPAPRYAVLPRRPHGSAAGPGHRRDAQLLRPGSRRRPLGDRRLCPGPAARRQRDARRRPRGGAEEAGGPEVIRLPASLDRLEPRLWIVGAVAAAVSLIGLLDP